MRSLVLFTAVLIAILVLSYDILGGGPLANGLDTAVMLTTASK